MRDKVKLLAKWLVEYEGSCVVHVGAGLSTAAGIPDFRGKRGVWTKMLNDDSHDDNNNKSSKLPAVVVKEETRENTKGHTNPASDADDDGAKIKPFDETQPTVGHMVLRQLCRAGHIRHIISQNVDGLFLKADFARQHVSELHGDFYLDECTKCKSRFIRRSASETMRLTRSAVKCPRNGEQQQQACSGHLRDTILDWESPIPYNELRVATREAKRAKLHICIGTSLQLRPSKDLVCDPEKVKSNKLVIINLQPTQFNCKASLIINYYADDVMRELANELDIEVPAYDPFEDPTKNADLIGSQWRK